MADNEDNEDNKDSVPDSSTLVPFGKRADGIDNHWSYDETLAKWVAPDGSLVDAPPPAPAERKGGFQKGNKHGKGPVNTYRAKNADIARELCQRGLKDIEIADVFGVSQSTLSRWRAKYPLFAEAFRLGKRMAHDRVERSLFEKAIGYEYETERVVQGHKVTLRQQLPPDTAAAIFYLKNRRPMKWKDVQRHESGPAGAFDQIEDAAELRRVLTKMAIDLKLIAPDALTIESTAVEITDSDATS